MKTPATRPRLTALEREFRDLWINPPGEPPGSGASFIPSVEQVRRTRRETAYHEAAHVVARAFTGLQWRDIVRVSLLPNAANLGRETVRGPHVEHLFINYEKPEQQSWGRSLLLQILAGRGADKRNADGDDWFEIIDDESIDNDTKGTDLYIANAIATTMSYPGMPPHRILAMAGRWTGEMLELPDVWATVENLAAILLERRVIEDSEVLESACGGILNRAWKLPKWKRRLAIDRGKRAPKFGRDLTT